VTGRVDFVPIQYAQDDAKRLVSSLITWKWASNPTAGASNRNETTTTWRPMLVTAGGRKDRRMG
jgi:hypothetical protein